MPAERTELFLDEALVEELVKGFQPADYLKRRLLKKIEVYKQLGVKHRRFYYWTTGLAIVSAALVPVLITVEKMNWLAIVFSLVVTVLVSVEGLFHFREHWRNYDNAEEALRREEFLFGTRAGLYEGKTPDEAYRLLVSKVEEIVHSERHETIQMRTSEQPAAELADQVKSEIRSLKAG